MPLKGIILAGGKGTRLYPITSAISKQILPVYDKPMIYYPLSVLMLAGIREICVISTPDDLPLFKKLLGDGSHIGCSFSYYVQLEPRGIAEAFLIAKEFIGDNRCALILGDNIFYSAGLQALLQKAAKETDAIIFAYRVADPQRYGVIKFNSNNEPEAVIEKPKDPPSNYAVVGLYFYPPDVSQIAATLKPSKRGELEITDLNNIYLSQKRLKVFILPRGSAWLDTGTFNSLSDASTFVKVVEERQGLKIGCIEEIAYRMNFISKAQLLTLAEKYKNSGYGDYLIKISNE